MTTTVTVVLKDDSRPAWTTEDDCEAVSCGIGAALSNGFLMMPDGDGWHMVPREAILRILIAKDEQQLSTGRVNQPIEMAKIGAALAAARAV